MIILSAEDSTLFTLSETATAIWQAAGGQTPLNQYRRREGLRRIRRRSRAGICRTQKASHRILLLSGKPKGAITPAAARAVRGWLTWEAAGAVAGRLREIFCPNR